MTYPGQIFSSVEDIKDSGIDATAYFIDKEGDAQFTSDLDSFSERYAPFTLVYDPAWSPLIPLSYDDPRIAQGATIQIGILEAPFIIDERVTHTSSIRESILSKPGYRAFLVQEALPAGMMAELQNARGAVNVMAVLRKYNWGPVENKA